VKKKSTRIKVPTQYHGYIVVPRPKGEYDLINPTTGQWARFPTQRYAKWSATFMFNIEGRFAANRPMEGIPKVKEVLA
jgi:hypothetical protein